MNKLKAIGAMCIVIFVVLIPTALSYQDLEYMEWCNEKGEMSIFYGKMTTEAVKDRDWVSLRAYSDLSYDFYSDVLDKIDQFDISPGYLSKHRDEYRAFYEDVRWSSYYAKKVADAFLSGNIGGRADHIESAASYSESSSEHIDKASEYMEKYIEELENAPSPTHKEDVETPGFGAILAIICVLVVGYFAIRRRK